MVGKLFILLDNNNADIDTSLLVDVINAISMQLELSDDSFVGFAMIDPRLILTRLHTSAVFFRQALGIDVLVERFKIFSVEKQS